MNTKWLITASIFAFIVPSMAYAADKAYAADRMVHHQPKHVISPVVAPSDFSWTGFYFGGQIGNFSSKISATTRDVDIPLFPDKNSKNKKWVPMEEKYLPKLSGFVGGLYAGANIDFGNSIVLGVDTDVLLSERKGTKTIVIVDNTAKDEANRVLQPAARKKEEKDSATFSHTIKQKWAGATRLRAGFSAVRAMYYVAGGVAYGQLQDTLSTLITGSDGFHGVSDDKGTMIGYTIGGGVDFAMTDNTIFRAEYRYSDFGKKKFGNEIELDYKTNDFRVGVAYKF
ncbi:outer membrane protein [Bartonella sp. B35(2025)]